MRAVTGRYEPDGSYAWWRLLASLALGTIGGIGMWSAVVVLPPIQAEFGVDRGGASLPYTATFIGFAVGGVLLGRLADRLGIMAAAPDRHLDAEPRLRRRRRSPAPTGSSCWPRPC